MGYEQTRTNLIEFDRGIEGMSLSIEEGSLLMAQFDLTRAFLSDEGSLSEKELCTKWTDRFKEFYHAQIVVNRLIDAVLALKDQSALKKTLKKVLAGSISQDFEPDQAKDYFYELEMAMLLKNAGFTVELREPDIVISGHGLTKKYGIACKYPSSIKHIHDHLSKGYNQLQKQGLDGFVAIGLDQIKFKGMNEYIDFRKLEDHPKNVIQGMLKDAMIELVEQRKIEYPAECPVDAAIVTLAASGIYGKPAALMTFRAITIHCDNQNPMLIDIKLIASELNKSKISVSVPDFPGQCSI